jgi:hypothetical protein
MSTSEDLSDFEKIAKALSFVKFTSVDDVLTALGLANLPTAQRYGIVVGICVFTLTVMTVLMLLVFGGSFARMAEQSKTGVPTVPEPIQARKSRALLLERLLEARERMMKENATKDPDVLTKRLENVACKNVAIPDLVEEASKRPKSGGDRYIPPGYQENYAIAYRKWQDKPGGMYFTDIMAREVVSDLVLLDSHALFLCWTRHLRRTNLEWEARSPVRGLCTCLCWMWPEHDHNVPSFLCSHV